MNNITTDIKLFQLTQDQARAIAVMKEFCTYSQNKLFRLTGYAGTGKTYVICQLIKWLQSHKYKVLAASPTNKAARNLRNMATENGINFLEVMTVARLLGQQAVINEETGKEEFISQGEDGIGSYDFIIVDEFSMINKDNFNDIQQALHSSKAKVIFVGDAAQLPPVGEKEPIIQNHYSIKDNANLKEVVRYDGKLAQIAETIRSHPRYNKIIYPFKTTEDKSIVSLDRWSWLQKAAKFFDSEEFKVNPNYVRFLTWRNKTASELNDYIRRELFKNSTDECINNSGKLLNYLKGDRLIAKSPIFRPTVYFTASGKEKTGWKIVMNASEECTVIKPGRLCHYDDTYSYEHYIVTVLTDDGINLDLRILTEKGLKEQKKDLMAHKQKKHWHAYYNNLKAFDNVPYAYAITTHKAQGSSINYVFMDILDMRNCPDLQKISYTALTRAKKQVFVPYF